MQNTLQDSPPNIPLDLFITEILPKFPPKTLLRFKALNKSFNLHISSQEFTTTHLNNTLSSNSNPTLIFCTAHRHGVQSLYSLEKLHSPHPRACHLPLPKPFRERKRNNYFDVIGSFNGLLCIRKPFFPPSASKCHFLLFNPSTGMALTFATKLSGFTTALLSRFGFGYDSVACAYTIVVLDFFREHDDQVFRFCGVFRLLSSDEFVSATIEVIETPHSHSLVRSWRRVSVNGVLVTNKLLHWVNLVSEDNTLFEIVCFDLEGEKWGDNVPLPVGFDDTGCENANTFVNLGVFDGCLCLSTKVERSSDIDVWVMKEYGVKNSWMKLKIAEPCCRYTPLYANGTKELLLSKDWPHTLGVDTCVWYNLENGKHRRLKFNGASPYFKVLTLSNATLAVLPNGIQMQKRKQEISMSSIKASR